MYEEPRVRKPRGKFIYQASDEQLTKPDESASPRRWRSFSPRMWGLYISWINSLKNPFIWADWDYDVYGILSEYAIEQEPDCPDCPDCPEPPPPNPQQPPDDKPRGAFTGMTLDELEILFMSFFGAPDGIPPLKWIAGALHWWNPLCCEWVKVPGGSGTTLTSGEKPPAELSLDDWIEAGSPALPPIQTIPHENALYTTNDSLKCAKATAIVNEIWNVIEGFSISFAQSSNFSLAATAAAGFLGRYARAFGASVNLGIQLNQMIFWAFTGKGYSEAAQALSDVAINTAAKDALICDLVDRMTAINLPQALSTGMTLNASEVQIALDRFDAIVPRDDSVRKILGFFPIRSWQEVIAGTLHSTECGCENYLPHGYIPVSGSQNMLQFLQTASATFHNDTNWNNLLGRSGALNDWEWLKYYQDTVPQDGQYKVIRQWRESDRPHIGGGIIYKFAKPVAVNSATMEYTGTHPKFGYARVLYEDASVEGASAVTFPDNATLQTVSHEFIFGNPSGKKVTEIFLRFIQRAGQGAAYPTPAIFRLKEAVVNTDAQGQITITPGVIFTS